MQTTLHISLYNDSDTGLLSIRIYSAGHITALKLKLGNDLIYRELERNRISMFMGFMFCYNSDYLESHALLIQVISLISLTFGFRLNHTMSQIFPSQNSKLLDKFPNLQSLKLGNFEVFCRNLQDFECLPLFCLHKGLCSDFPKVRLAPSNSITKEVFASDYSATFSFQFIPIG